MMTPTQEAQQRIILTAAHHNHANGLNAHAFFKMHDRATSENMVQDTFIKTWSYLYKRGEN